MWMRTAVADAISGMRELSKVGAMGANQEIEKRQLKEAARISSACMKSRDEIFHAARVDTRQRSAELIDLTTVADLDELRRQVIAGRVAARADEHRTLSRLKDRVSKLDGGESDG